MSCGCPSIAAPSNPAGCVPASWCPPENFGLSFPSLVGPQGPPGGPGTYVENLALLRLINAAVFSQGYIANVGGHTTYNDQGGGLFFYDPVSVAADNNGTIVRPANGIGRWIRMFNGPVSVRWFGARGNGVTDDHAAIQAALDAYVSIWFPEGNYIISTVIRASRVVNIGGDEQAIITAGVGFTGVAITKNGAPFTLKAIIAVFSGTDIGSQANPRLGESGRKVAIGPMLLACANNCDYGLLINSTPGAQVYSSVSGAANTGIWAGPNCWGSAFWHPRITDCVSVGIYLGEACNGAAIYCPEIWGNSLTFGVGVYLEGTASGVVGAVGQVLISGGYIEKGVTGVYLKNTGSVNIHSVDIEGITGNCVYADCSAGATTAFLSIKGCNLSSLSNAIYNKNAAIAVDYCGIADGATLEPYYSDTPYSTFNVGANNFYYSGPAPSAPPVLTTTQSIKAQDVTRYSLRTINKRLTDGGAAFSRSWFLANLASDSQPDEISTAIECRNSNFGGVDLQYRGSMALRANITHSPGGINPAIKSSACVLTDFDGSEVKQHHPETDNDMRLGIPTLRWKAVHSALYYSADNSVGVSGSFTTVDGKTVTVKNGLITAIV